MVNHCEFQFTGRVRGVCEFESENLLCLTTFKCKAAYVIPYVPVKHHSCMVNRDGKL